MTVASLVPAPGPALLTSPLPLPLPGLHLLAFPVLQPQQHLEPERVPFPAGRPRSSRGGRCHRGP